MSLVPGSPWVFVVVSLSGRAGWERFIGRGTSKLDRDVAIKVLPTPFEPRVPKALGFELRPKAGCSSLSSKHSRRSIDFGTQDGIAYAVMELLDGETPRQDRRRADPQKQAIDYGSRSPASCRRPRRSCPSRPEAREPLRHRRTAASRSSISAWPSAIEKVAPVEKPTLRRRPATPNRVPSGDRRLHVARAGTGCPVDRRRTSSVRSGPIRASVRKKAFRRDTAADTMSAILKEDPAELSEFERSVPSRSATFVTHCLRRTSSGDSSP